MIFAELLWLFSGAIFCIVELLDMWVLELWDAFDGFVCTSSTEHILNMMRWTSNTEQLVITG